MKKIGLAVMLMLGIAIPAYAVNMSIDSVIDIANAPANSKWQTECGPSTGNYTSTKQFTMVAGDNKVPAFAIFPSAGNYFCRTSFVQPYGQSAFSTELSITVTVPTLATPSLTVIP